MPNKMERFTQRARRVLSLAQDEAERLQHNYIGTEHILLGLMNEEGGVAGRVLRDLGLEQRRVEELVERMTRATTRMGTYQLDLSPGTKRVLELAVSEARQMGHPYIGTEHLLLGLVRLSEGTAIEVLKRLGISPDDVRQQIQRILEKTPPQVSPLPARETFEVDVLESLKLSVETSLLLKLLSQFTSSLEGLGEVPAKMKELVGQVLSERSIVLNEDFQTHLLVALHKSLKPPEDNRQLHVYITEKATREMVADMRIYLSETRGRLQMVADAAKSLPPGQAFILQDDQWLIELSIEDEQGTEGGS
jgi:hypothetical protein